MKLKASGDIEVYESYEDEFYSKDYYVGYISFMWDDDDDFGWLDNFIYYDPAVSGGNDAEEEDPDISPDPSGDEDDEVEPGEMTVTISSDVKPDKSGYIVCSSDDYFGPEFYVDVKDSEGEMLFEDYDYEVVYESSNPGILEVSEYGFTYPVKEGEVTLTVKVLPINGGDPIKTETFKVKVVKGEVEIGTDEDTDDDSDISGGDGLDDDEDDLDDLDDDDEEDDDFWDDEDGNDEEGDESDGGRY